MIAENTREAIRNRMIRRAAEAWGFPDADIELFDPIVSLLLGTFSVELENAFRSIQDSESRILHKIARLMTPEVMTGARPAHALLHSRCSEPSVVVTSDFSFTTRKEFIPEGSKTPKQQEISFSPAHRYKVFDSDIKYLVFENKAYNLDNISHKVLTIKSIGQNQLPANECWLGIDIHNEINDIEGLAFYFDWRNDVNKNFYLQSIPLTNWYIEDQKVQIKAGNYIAPSASLQEHILLTEEDYSAKDENHIEGIYKSNFIHFSKNPACISPDLGGVKTLKKAYPSQFQSLFMPNELQRFSDDLLWVKVVFPEIFMAEQFENMTIAVNVFPVMNRTYQKTNFRLQDTFNIFPLFTESYFYTIHQIQSSAGISYSPQWYASAEDQNRYYLLRYGGVGRFDVRSAYDMVNYLHDLLLIESREFTALNQDAIFSLIKDLKPLVSQLEYQKMQMKVDMQHTPYVVIHSPEVGEHIYVEFWTTEGEYANGIMDKLTPDKYILRSNVTKLLSTSVGGRNPLREADTLFEYKRLLMTHDRIVTAEDMKAVCLAYFEKMKQNVTVEVTKGVVAPSDMTQGLLRVINVAISFTRKSKTDYTEKEKIAEELQYMLQSQSSGILPIHVTIREREDA